MRAYTSTYLAACWLLSAASCGSDPEPEPYYTPTSNEERQPDAGPTNCDLRGTWEITLGTEDECSPDEAGAAITLTVDESGTDDDDFQVAELPPSSPHEQFEHEVQVTAEGCTIRASSSATWSVAMRPQCSEYELTVHVRGNEADAEADVEGEYRRCWCGSPSAYGTKVRVAGSAHRR